MEIYKHKVHYYETDKMGITHHSNYVRWMEEARVDYLDKIGWNFARLESMGIVSPVTGINVSYKAPSTFDEEITIYTSIAEFKGVKLKIRYNMVNSEEKTVCEAFSEHCFMNLQGGFIRFKKDFPELYEAFTSRVEGDEVNE